MRPLHYSPTGGRTIDELGIRDKTIGVPPAGCAVLAYNYFDVDMGEAPHGRAVAVATGIKRIEPDKVVFTYQGDGDIAAIGTAETIHAANRGEKITVIFVNNAVYGMTGGQMAPTTMLGRPPPPRPAAGSAKRDGMPVDLSEMLGRGGWQRLHRAGRGNHAQTDLAGQKGH